MMSNREGEIAGPPAADFKLLTNHGQTLLLITYDPRARMRDIAALLNITERAAQRIVADLVRAGYVHRQRDGRRNRYSVRTELPLTLPIQHDIQVGSLLAALLPQPEPTDTDPRDSAVPDFAETGSRSGAMPSVSARLSRKGR